MIVVVHGVRLKMKAWGVSFLHGTQILYIAICVFAAVTCSGQNETDARVDIHIGGLFAFQRSPVLALQPGVAQTALDHVNSLAGILGGYHLAMRWNWTGAGDPEQGLGLLYELVHTGPNVPIIWGPIVAQQAIVVNQVAARFNIVQVILASSRILADRSLYPYTVQAVYSETQTFKAVVKLFKTMGWRRIAVIYAETPSFQATMNAFRESLEAEDIHVVVSEGVKDTSKFEFHLQSIKRQDARIIYTGFFRDELLKLFCQAYQSGIYGAKYVWVGPIWAKYAWWLDASPDVIAPCTQKQINMAVNYTLHFDGNPRRVDASVMDFNGVKPLPEHYDYYNNDHPDNDLLAYTYDGIIAIALALNASITDLHRLDPPRRLEDFSYSDEEMAKVILKNAGNLDFNGLLGRFLIEDGQRQTYSVYVEQARGSMMETTMVYMAQKQQLLNHGDSALKWEGGHVPVDGVTKRETILEISSTTRAVLFSIASLGITVALVFLVINIKYKNKRAIKMSSPSLSNLTVVGCLLLYASVFASGWDKTDLSDTAIVIKCHGERILISLGLSLTFGSIFMKTYRIHAIFTLAVKQFKKIDLPDWKLIGGVMAIAFFDCVIFILWIAMNTENVYSHYLEPQLNMTEPEKEVFDVHVIRFCSSERAQYLTVALYGTKGVLLVFGLFLAWETRNICVSRLNDSKYIAASLYIVSLTTALTVPTMTVMGDDVNMTFAIPGFAIVTVNTCVLCLNFIPKVYLLLTVDETDISLSMMQSLGSKDTATTSINAEQTSKLTQLHAELESKQGELRHLCATYRRLRRNDRGADWTRMDTRLRP